MKNNYDTKFQKSPKSQSHSNFNSNFDLTKYSEFELELQPAFSLNVFHFFHSFLKVGYHLFLIPFKFRETAGLYYIHTNLYQQIFSTILFLTIFLSSMLDMRFYFSSGLMNKPEKAFTYSHAVIVQVGYCLCWFKTFWLGRNNFQKLLHFCQNKGLTLQNPPQNLWLYSITAVLFCSEMKLLWEQITSDIIGKGFLGTFQFYGGIGLYNVHLRDNDAPIAEEEMSILILLFGIFYTFIMNMLRQIEHLVEVLTFIGAVAAYYSARKFVSALHGKSVVSLYTKFSEEMSHINDICGSVVLIYTVGMVPTFVWCVFGMFEMNSVDYLIYYVHKFVMHLSILFIAAEANAKAHEFTDWILKFLYEQNNFYSTRRLSLLEQEMQKNYNVDSHEDTKIFTTFLNFAHREMCTYSVGLKGSKFFTLSYNFIGATLSVIVTYAVIMLQFQVEKYQKSAKNVSGESLIGSLNTTYFSNDTLGNNSLVSY